MKRFRIWSIVFMLSCFGVGCDHLHVRRTPPHQALAPTAPAPVAPLVPPAIVLEPPVAPLLLPPPAESDTVPVPVVQPAPKKKYKHRVHPHQKKKIVTDNADVAADNPSPLGMLSAGDSSANPALRQQTVKLIASTESRLKTISRRVAANRHDTLTQVQDFLAQAKKALDINDLQGAQTLATKAKILVDEMLR